MGMLEKKEEKKSRIFNKPVDNRKSSIFPGSIEIKIMYSFQQVKIAIPSWFTEGQHKKTLIWRVS